MGERERRWSAVYAHRERLLRLARARLDNPHDAEDCVQEAMLRCVEFAGLDEERLGQFLTTVTIRLCTDVHRGRLRGDKLSRRMTSFFTHDPSPEESICDRAESVWLSGHLAELTPRQRAIVEARAEGLSCGAVAERLTLPYTTVESALARVRRSLRVALDSTLGIAAVPSWTRVRRVLAGGLAATAAAVTVAGFVDLPGRRTPPPSGAEVAVPERRLDLRTQGDSRTSMVVAVVDRGSPVVVKAVRPVPTDLAIRRSGSRKSGETFADGRKLPLSEGRMDHDYSDAERTVHCVQYGVAVGRVVQCRYPQGHPNNIDERYGTPAVPLPEGGQ